jgi:cell division protein FtsQ
VVDVPRLRRRGAPANERSRKRFARRQWRRRWLAWRVVVALVLLLALLGTGVYAVWFSSWLDVDEIDVSGALHVDADEIRDRSGIEASTPLATVDLAAAETRIRSLAIVKTAQVERQWPDTVRISITERVAIAVVEIGGKLRGMDADGVVFREYAKAPPGLPRVETDIGTTPDALKEAALVIAALPESLSLIVDHLHVTTVDEIELILKDGREVVWGSADDSATKAEVLADLLKTPAKVYDVSVPTHPTTSDG